MAKITTRRSPLDCQRFGGALASGATCRPAPSRLGSAVLRHIDMAIAADGAGAIWAADRSRGARQAVRLHLRGSRWESRSRDPRREGRDQGGRRASRRGDECGRTGEAQTLVFRTNVGDIVSAGRPLLRFAIEEPTDGLKPYVRVPRRAGALATRALAQDLVALATEQGGASASGPGVNLRVFPSPPMAERLGRLAYSADDFRRVLHG
jgi:hypothetical protein